MADFSHPIVLFIVVIQTELTDRKLKSRPFLFCKPEQSEICNLSYLVKPTFLPGKSIGIKKRVSNYCTCLKLRSNLSVYKPF